MVSFGSKEYNKRLLHLVSWSHWFTFFNIIAAILLSSFYLFNEVSPETLLGKFYLITTWLSHMGFLTFIGFVLLIFPLTIVMPHTRFIRGTASVIFTFGLLLLLLDAFIYSRLGYHLNASSSDQILALIQAQINQNNRSFWFISIILLIAIFVFQLVVSNYAWKHLRELQKTVFAKYITIGLVAAFFFSHILHIWADANLEYDILRQDTVLPLSYPSTAKTLLTKYGMFDKDDYLARRTTSLSFSDPVPAFPSLTNDCIANEPITESTFLVLTDKLLNEEQIKRFDQRVTTNKLRLTKHIDNALPQDALFNLIYSLPSIYKEEVLAQNRTPLLFNALSANKLTSSLTIFGEETNDKYKMADYHRLFTNVHQAKDISNLVLTERFNSFTPGLHIFFFSSENHYQYELFIDALLLSQRHKSIKDNIWISSVGNENKQTSLSIKPALFVLPNTKSKQINMLTSQMDLQPTLMKHWLACKTNALTYSAGNDIVELDKSRVIANTMSDGIMVFNKDKSVFIDQNGNFQSYSRQLESPIMVSSDFPLMIDGVNFIKQFALHNKVVQ